MRSRRILSPVTRVLSRLQDRTGTQTPSEMLLTAGMALGPLLVLTTAGVFLAALLADAPKSHQESAAVAPAALNPTNTPAANPEDQWLACLKPQLTAHDQRLDSCKDFAGRLYDGAYAVTSPQGVGQFVETVSGLNSKAKWTSNRLEWRRWVTDQYRRYVFPVDRYRQLVNAEVASLNLRLQQIDNDALVEMAIDAPFDSAGIPTPRFALNAIDGAVDQAVASIIPAIESAFATHVAGFIGGAATGNAVYDATLKYSQDERGQNSFGQKLIAFGLGFAADAATSAAVSAATGDDEELRQQVVESLDDVRRATVGAESPGIREVIEYLRALLQTHKQCLADAVIAQLGVDSEWAAAVYNQAALAFNQANTAR